MVTMAFDFKPWRDNSYFGSAKDILRYLGDTVDEYGLGPHVRYNHRVAASAFDSATNRWTVQLADSSSKLKCRFLIFGQGYYSYSKPHRPRFAREEQFEGRIVHAQFWPEDVDLANKRVAMIGSGATAVTLLPHVAAVAEKATMVQRSPGYVFAAPSTRPWACLRDKWYVPRCVYDWVSRYWDIYEKLKHLAIATKMPGKIKLAHRVHVKDQLGDSYGNFDPADFRPKYDVWDQRVCVAPGGDFFKALKSGKADVVTGTIRSFAPGGITMDDDRFVPADLIVLATGLTMELKLNLTVDGTPVKESDCMLYRQTFLSDVPNCAILFGSTVESWTLSLGPACRFICSHLNYMRRKRYARVVVPKDPSVTPRPVADLQANYIKRATVFPTAGTVAPWRYYHDYLRILWTFLAAKFDTNARYSR
mmetsp:Transcript_21135/g.65225  ORF Transcript_21135/g.65225 Transcript_21135/m.65225 type:complete len:420 (+) Transcript_21135:255-1514(+)